MDTKKFLDRAGVQYLWKQLSMEDYPNNQTLIAVINAIDESKADKISVEDNQNRISSLENFTGKTNENFVAENTDIPTAFENYHLKAQEYFLSMMPTERDAVELLAELELVRPTADENNAVFVSGDKEVYLI